MLPIELIRRMSVTGYTTVAITDHVDTTNTESVSEISFKFRESAQLFGVISCAAWRSPMSPLSDPALAKLAKDSGADIVVVHGETLVEPVAPGTNHAACACTYVDVLAHPGLIDPPMQNCGKKRHGTGAHFTGWPQQGEWACRKVAREAGCQIVVDSDAHTPHDLLDKRAKFNSKRAGLSDQNAGR